MKLNRINYNFGIKVHLYFNANSRNRTSDSTPRYFLKPIELLSVEKVGFSKKAKDYDYFEHGHRFWKYKMAWELTAAKAEALYEKIKNSYPYGYDSNDSASVLKYREDVKYNEAYQAFYAKYWNNHESLQVKNNLYDHPYIEFDVNEVIQAKWSEDVPEVDSAEALWAEYKTDKTKYETAQSYSCHDEDIYVHVNEAADPNNQWFYMNGYPQGEATLDCSGTYNFHLISGALENPTPSWPTGVGGAASGALFSLSTGMDGTHEGNLEYTANVDRFVSPQSYALWDYTIAGGQYYVTVNGTPWEAPTLTATRGSTYLFTQTGSTNDDHPVYISTTSSAGGANVFSSGVTHITGDHISGEGYVSWKVPFEAPNSLYYSCKNHTNLGGNITVIDPVAAEGDQPGETIRVKFTETGNGTMWYYAAGTSGMGGPLFLRDNCEGVDLY
jgi:hypothetical protein